MKIMEEENQLYQLMGFWLNIFTLEGVFIF